MFTSYSIPKIGSLRNIKEFPVKIAEKKSKPFRWKKGTHFQISYHNRKESVHNLHNQGVGQTLFIFLFKETQYQEIFQQ